MKNAALRILLVDDHSIVRMGFAALLGAEKDFEIVAEAEDAAQALTAYRNFRPDVTLMDARMPGGNGIEALKSIKAEFPDARIIIMTTYDLDEPVFMAFDAGASGYLLKSITRDDLIESIRLVHAGGHCFPASLDSQIKARNQNKRLTRREVETLNLLRRGLSNRDIGVALGVSENTAKAHMKAIFLKLDVADRAEAVTAGFERGLLQVESRAENP